LPTRYPGIVSPLLKLKEFIVAYSSGDKQTLAIYMQKDKQLGQHIGRHHGLADEAEPSDRFGARSRPGFESGHRK
jgi:hypothetical protein